MRRMLRHPLSLALRLCALGPALLAALPGCHEGCLRGEEGCQVESPCRALTFACGGDDRLEVRQLNQADAAALRGGWNALSARGDLLLANGQVLAVIAGLGNQNLLDPNGGSLLDLRGRDRKDDAINQVLPIVGILPRDSASYTEVRLIDERPARVAVQLRGTLLDQPDVPIYTLYEVRPCEPGVRVRTEIVNGTRDPQLWTLADGFYWSGREMLPFTPGPGSGFQHPSFNLLTIDDAFRTAPFLASSTHSDPQASYAAVGCQQDRLEGFHANQVSSLGNRRAVVPPREHLVFERFLAYAASGGVGGAADIAQEVRAQLRAEPLITLRGKIDRSGALGTEREASVLILEGTASTPAESRVPWTQVVPDASGAFSARVPAGRDYVVELHSFGRKLAERQIAASPTDRDIGTLSALSTARLRTLVREGGQGIPAEIFVVAADEAGRVATEGSLHGLYEKCSPWLGVPYGSSPACNRFLVPAQGTSVDVPPGRYHLYAYHGPFYTLERKTLALQAGDTNVEFELRPLPLLPRGAVSADLHVHGAASFDSSIPDPDRVLSFAAADVGVIVATDHDVVYDYAPVVEQLGLADRVSTVVGIETTGHVPFMKIPGSDFPLVIGHYNFWPLTYQPGLPRNGGPFDEFVEPGELFDRVEALFQKGRVSVIQLNHPYADAEFGRDLGFPRALGLNLLQDLPAADDGTVGGMYIRSPKGGHRNNDHHTQEVMNGTQNDIFLQYRAFWFYSLNQGQLRTGTANSDSHGLTDNTVGSPRSVVFAGTQAGKMFEQDRFNQAIRDGAVLGTNGPIITATVDTTEGALPYGLKPVRPAPGGALHLEVSAAPWVPVQEIRVFVNGRLAKTITALSQPSDPFGAAGTLRYMGQVPLAELLPPSGADAWVVIEAGAALPVFADLGGGAGDAPDGIPDTSDNDGNGVVDERDVEAGKKTGPLRNPPAPKEGDAAYHFAQVVTGGYPLSFTNPFVLDVNGNGKFDAPKGAK